MTPTILISASCWRQMSAELDRVAPAEGVMVPLVALEMVRPEHNPCARIELTEIARLVIARLVTVPPELQVNRGARVHVLPRTNRAVNGRLEREIARRPRLRACSYLHSHPFAVGTTRPSRGWGCDYEGHLLPLWRHNRRGGLDTSFSFIACRHPAGGWRLLGFGLDDEQRIVDLGPAEIVSDADPAVQRALLLGLWDRPADRAVLRRWRRELHRKGLNPRHEELFGGWQRLIFNLDHGRRGVALVPIEFPAVEPQLWVVNGAPGARRFEPGMAPSIESPHRISLVPDGLVRVAEKMKGEPG